MTKNLFTLGAIAAVLLGLPAQEAAAQDDRSGTQAMEELLVPVTPRTIALGSAITGGLGNLNGVEAVLSNPAATLASTGTDAMFSRSDYVLDIGINYAGVAQRFGANSVALTLMAWDYGDIDLTTTGTPDPIAGNPITYTASSFAVGATYSRQFTDRIGAGLTLKALGRRIADVSTSGLGVDAGITYVVEEAGLRFGVALRNLGPQMDFNGSGLNQPVPNPGPIGEQPVAGEIRDLAAQLPSTLNFGASYTRQFAGDVSLSALAGYQSRAYDPDQYTGGLELGYANLIYARGGFALTSSPDQDMWQNWNIGAGLNLPLAGQGLRVDYAYRPTEVFGGVNVFSVGIGL